MISMIHFSFLLFEEVGVIKKSRLTHYLFKHLPSNRLLNIPTPSFNRVEHEYPWILEHEYPITKIISKQRNWCTERNLIQYLKSYCILPHPEQLLQSYFKGSSGNGRDPTANSILTPHNNCDLRPPMCETQQNWNSIWLEGPYDNHTYPRTNPHPRGGSELMLG